MIFAFPNEYSVGITSLGYQVVWAGLASRPDVQVSRLFTDTRESLPSRPELLGFSLSWELDYANILSLLGQLDIPLRASDRIHQHPLVFGGGPVLTANPEPFADFFDVILLGDGENLLDEFVSAYQTVRHANRLQQLRQLAKVPGIYVPSLYEVTYTDPEGVIASVTPRYLDIPAQVEKQTYRGNVLSASTVVTERAAWENIYMVEVVRSCPEMCRFCLASYLTLPFRTASLEGSLIPAIERGLQVTQRLGLLGASVTQHPQFGDLLTWLDGDRFEGTRVSVSSVRAATVTPELGRILAKRGSKSLTIAIESGSERMRRVVNKKLETGEIFAAARYAKEGGLSGLKLYGMVGVPTEEDPDVEATAALLLDQRQPAQSQRRIPMATSLFELPVEASAGDRHRSHAARQHGDGNQGGRQAPGVACRRSLVHGVGSLIRRPPARSGSSSPERSNT